MSEEKILDSVPGSIDEITSFLEDLDTAYSEMRSGEANEKWDEYNRGMLKANDLTPVVHKMITALNEEERKLLDEEVRKMQGSNQISSGYDPIEQIFERTTSGDKE